MRSVSGSMLVLAAVCLLPACGGADESLELGEDQSLGEVSQAQPVGPSTGGACTIEKCSGIKDPFGTYTCDANNKCTCGRGGTTGTCDSEGKNCKEKCETTTSRPGRDLEIDVHVDEVYAGDDSNHVNPGGVIINAAAP